MQDNQSSAAFGRITEDLDKGAGGVRVYDTYAVSNSHRSGADGETSRPSR
jgi:hypothetical protein